MTGSARASTPTPISGEVPVAARLAFDELGRAVGGIAGMHRAIAGRAFGASGPGATPARVIHDAISGGVYAAVRASARLAGQGAALAVSAAGAGRPSSRPRRRGASALAVVNGLIGDQLEREGSELQQPLAVRVGGRAVAAEPARARGGLPGGDARASWCSSTA